jgi:NAD(P)-dependent dehydrogenase (short-subunit alcohol dehydrogenase family)
MSSIALITGANRGIGVEIARQLARQGMQVVIGAREIADGQHAAERIHREGGTAAVLQMDVRETASIPAAAQAFPRIADLSFPKTQLAQSHESSRRRTSGRHPLGTMMSSAHGPSRAPLPRARR